ncbi:MAG TPA: aspartate/glutamate racemase family protein [Anaerolineaceae bacterium]
MRILFINPNTTEEFTRRVQETVNLYAGPNTTAVACNPSAGPRSIASIYDELLSSGPTLELAINQMDQTDAFVIACVSDHPTVYALREISDKPAIGIFEASIYFAMMLGHKFSVVTTDESWEPLLWDGIRHFGAAERCASVRSTRLPVLALEALSEDETYRVILETSKLAIEQDNAEVICLGCAGMSGMDKRLEAELGLPVVDGVVAGLKLMEGLVGYSLHTSKKRAYIQPGRVELPNLPPVFSRPYHD